MDGLTFRRLLELRSARVERLMDETKSMEQNAKDRERQEIREQILEK